MCDIAERANISRPPLYLHFDSKEDIFCEIVRQLHRQTLDEAQTVLNQKNNIVRSLN